MREISIFSDRSTVVGTPAVVDSFTPTSMWTPSQIQYVTKQKQKSMNMMGWGVSKKGGWWEEDGDRWQEDKEGWQEVQKWVQMGEG